MYTIMIVCRGLSLPALISPAHVSCLILIKKKINFYVEIKKSRKYEGHVLKRHNAPF
jgi:hypothetical protein